jgi:hypothetical protein
MICYFSKLALFGISFEEAAQLMTSHVIQPGDDPWLDVTACVS